jgi:Uma2 family endonuclease
MKTVENPLERRPAMSTATVSEPALLERLTPALAGTLMTPEEFDAVPDVEEGYRYELIHGVLVVSPSPLLGERDPNEELGRLLRNYQADHPEGAAMNFTISEHTIDTRENRRRADRVIWAGLGRKPRIGVDFPTIIVEFVSKARRDRRRDYVEKRAEYLDAGVAEYWIFDRFHRVLTVCVPNAADRTILAEQPYRTPLLPGFELLSERFFTLGDNWKSEEAAD